ncbi:MAG: IS630 family transposase [Longimicrobiales bacterium]
MANETPVLRLRRGDRAVLEAWTRSRTLQRRLVDRARIVLAAADRQSSRSISQLYDVPRATVLLWTRRYKADGIAGIQQDRPRAGRPRIMTADIETVVIEKTVTEAPPPEVATHWSTRLMAKATGYSREAIGRIWRKYALKPHQIKRFKLSRDPRLFEKIHDVVGLYMDPPVNAVVFSFDEKSQMQALDRNQPGLPLKKGRAGTMTHDYKRYGTTTLFAALNVATGETIHECMPRHRHQEFLKFLRKVERSVEPGLQIHVILDNYATHKHEKVRRWLKRTQRVHLHFVPTGASWLNMVERLFSELTEKQLKRLAVTSVAELEAVVMRYLNHRNTQPKPFIWTKSAKVIIAKIERGLQTFASVH